MLIFQKHIFKHLSRLFFLVCFILTSIVWLSQALKLVYLITKGISLSTFFIITFLTLPSMLLSIIPISLFLSVVFYYNKIKNDREMIIMENSGLNYLQIAKPAIILSLILTLVSYSISLYFLPLSYSKLKNKLESLKENYTTALIHAKTFNPISKQVTLYVDKKYNNGSLGGLIIFDYRESSEPAIIFAKIGQLIVKDNDIIFRLINGTRQGAKTKERIDQLKFNDLIINMHSKNHSHQRITKDIQEKYLYELFVNKEDNLLHINKLRAEGHQRLAWPLFNVALVLVALHIIIPAYYNRKPNSKTTFFACMIAIFIVIINFVSSNLSIKHQWFDYIIYLNLIVISYIAYNKLRERENVL